MENNQPSNQTEVTPTPTPVVSSQETSGMSPDKVMGVLCYLGPLVLIPFLTKKEDPFVGFHVKQGLVVLGIEIVLWILTGYLFMITFGLLYPIIKLLELGLLALSIIGIYNVVKGEQKVLPLIGQFSSYLKF